MRLALVSPLSAGLEQPPELHPSYRLLKQETQHGCKLFVIVGIAVISKGSLPAQTGPVLSTLFSFVFLELSYDTRTMFIFIKCWVWNLAGVPGDGTHASVCTQEGGERWVGATQEHTSGKCGARPVFNEDGGESVPGSGFRMCQEMSEGFFFFFFL